MGCGSTIFGSSAQYIKVGNGDFMAIEGANVVDKLNISDLRMPYKQLLRSRILLKEGQENYLLNHLGLGDNATFLCIKATYNQKSLIEEDNYINWSYYDDLGKVYQMSHMLVLTGNSTKRIKQLYLSNPNSLRAVSLDVMVAVIDDTYKFFNDSINQSSTSFTGLEWTDIRTHIVGQSIKINDKGTPIRPLIYFDIFNIQTISKTGNIILIDDSSFGTIFLQFLTEPDAYQAQSILNYVKDNPNTDIDEYMATMDLTAPILYFNNQVGDRLDSEFIRFNGEFINGPYDTSFGLTFSTTMSLLEFGTASGTYFDKPLLIDLLINNLSDNRDGIMGIQPDNLIINNSNLSVINTPGTYSVTFNISDFANNRLEGVHIDLTINE